MPSIGYIKINKPGEKPKRGNPDWWVRRPDLDRPGPTDWGSKNTEAWEYAGAPKPPSIEDFLSQFKFPEIPAPPPPPPPAPTRTSMDVQQEMDSERMLNRRRRGFLSTIFSRYQGSGIGGSRPVLGGTQGGSL